MDYEQDYLKIISEDQNWYNTALENKTISAAFITTAEDEKQIETTPMELDVEDFIWMLSLTDVKTSSGL